MGCDLLYPSHLLLLADVSGVKPCLTIISTVQLLHDRESSHHSRCINSPLQSYCISSLIVKASALMHSYTSISILLTYMMARWQEHKIVGCDDHVVKGDQRVRCLVQSECINGIRWFGPRRCQRVHWALHRKRCKQVYLCALFAQFCYLKLNRFRWTGRIQIGLRRNVACKRSAWICWPLMCTLLHSCDIHSSLWHTGDTASMVAAAGRQQYTPSA